MSARKIQIKNNEIKAAAAAKSFEEIHFEV